MNLKALVFAALAVTVFSATANADGHAADHSVQHVSPQGLKDIVETAASNHNFDTLLSAVIAAGLTDTLKGDGPFTVFAPTDAAFDALPEGTVENLLKPENKDKLAAILTYHVVPGKVSAKDVVGLSEAATVQGNSITVTTNDSGVLVDGASVITTDIEAKNGVIHVIDAVLLPNS